MLSRRDRARMGQETTKNTNFRLCDLVRDLRPCFLHHTRESDQLWLQEAV